MAKDVIQVNGEDRVVREDTAKAFRGVNWALVSIAGFILIMGILFLVFFGPALHNTLTTPAENSTIR